MADIDTKFEALNSLDKLFPFFRCPECGERKDFLAKFLIEGICPVKVDNPTKMFTAHTDDEATGEWSDIRLHCNKCHHDFPFPKEWGLKVT